jgi:hypothetical protein
MAKKRKRILAQMKALKVTNYTLVDAVDGGLLDVSAMIDRLHRVSVPLSLQVPKHDYR